MTAELPLNTANALATALNTGVGANGLTTFGQDHVCRVSGIESMSSFPTKPNSDYAIFEANSDVFCWKTTDPANKATDRYFFFQEISKEEALRRSSPYLMKGELDSFKADILSAISAEMANFKEEILNGQQSIRSNPGSNSKYAYGRNESESTNFGESK